MGFRVVRPTLLRVTAYTSTVAGIAFILAAGVRGPLALIGAVLLSFGIAVLDALALERLSLRQVSMFLGILGLAIGAWAGAVIAAVRLLDVGSEAAARHVFGVALALAAASLVCLLVADRRRALPVPLEARRSAGAEGELRRAS